MRQDQYEKLQALGEKLLDVFIGEADPDKWPGAGQKPDKMSQQVRGDRVWSKRDAAATLIIVTKLETLVQRTQELGAGTTPADPDSDEAGELATEMQAAEREANKLMAKLQERKSGGKRGK